MAKMIHCKTCSKEIASNAKSCPNCGAKNKKPIYKRPWFIIIMFFVIAGVLVALSDTDVDNSTTASIGTTVPEQKVSQNQTTKEQKTDKEEKSIPAEYTSALKKAKTYSDIMHMSKAAIYDQLTSEYGEKFTKEAAKYAMDNLEANWKENALKKAQNYQETMSMSPSAIYDQLISEYGEKFTKEEAQYAIDNLE